jgi:hypothetical protein
MRRMKAHSLLGLACLVALQMGCTTLVPLRYTPDSAPAGAVSPTPLISVGAFADSRGPRADADWLGAIRGGFGNRLKTLRTQQPMSQVVQDAYADGLRARGVFAERGQGKFVLEGTIEKLDCSEYFNLEAHAHVALRVRDSTTGAQVFEWPYRVDETEGGLGAGIFGSVETLRLLAERTLRELVDRSLDDPGLRKAVQTLPPQTP